MKKIAPSLVSSAASAVHSAKSIPMLLSAHVVSPAVIPTVSHESYLAAGLEFSLLIGDFKPPKKKKGGKKGGGKKGGGKKK